MYKAGEIEVMKENLLKKDAIIEKMKKDNEVVVAQLEEKCAELLHVSTITKLQAEKDLKQYTLFFKYSKIIIIKKIHLVF